MMIEPLRADTHEDRLTGTRKRNEAVAGGRCGREGEHGGEGEVTGPPTPWVALSADELVGVLDRLTDGILVLGA